MLSTLIIAAFLVWFFASIRGLQDRLGKAKSAISDLKLKLQRADGAPLARARRRRAGARQPTAQKLPPPVEPAPANGRADHPYRPRAGIGRAGGSFPLRSKL